MKTLKTVVITLLVIGLLGLGLAYAGAFNVAADQPHWGITTSLLETARDRSIAAGASGVQVPGYLEDDKIVASGAGEYAEMCTGCHLAPGMKENEMRAGLYPKPPALAEHGGHRSAAEQFWILKHGIKMSGMPAWGPTHDDERLWSMVAFLRKLPGLSAEQYEALVAAGGGHHHDDDGEESGGHSHEHAEAAPATTASTLPPLSGAAADAAAVIDDFQHRLHHGDTKRAAQLLEPSVLIFEGGNAEKSRDEYASHHLGADSEFLKKAKVQPLMRRGGAAGDFAWVATESEITVSGEKPLALISTETMVLEKTAEGWRVAHIHWSSREKK